MTRAGAAAKIAAAGFTLGTVAYDETATGTAGTVVAQTPEGGSRAADRARVAITVAGLRPVAAPALGSLPAGDATAALAAAGLTLGSSAETYSATVPEGQVISQDPAPGTAIAPGTPVHVVISKGPAPVAVPNVVNKTEAVATAALTAAGLKVTVTRQAAETTAGTVIAQKPASGNVKRGTTVAIIVSSGMLALTNRILGSWKGSDGSTYTFRVGNRVVTPLGGVVRYSLHLGALIVRSPNGMVTAQIRWVTANRFEFREELADGLGPTVTYNRVK
jgi:serine/threonine-protein kinase